MRRRAQNRKVQLSVSQDEDYDVQEDSLNQDYVQKKRATKKGSKANRGARGEQKKRKKKQEKESEDSMNASEEVIEFKHGDEQVKQHYRPTFIQRWNGMDNQIQILPNEYAQMSPMFKVYWETKSKNMNAIIFLQFGKMEYFAFENDAIILHEIFKKKLKHFSAFLMVNFWCKEIIVAKQELFDRGIPVLMMNEFNDPVYRRQHGIIRRQIDEVITPGIHLDMQDKAYKERWCMTFYVSDTKPATKKSVVRQSKDAVETQKDDLKKASVILLDSESNKFYIQQFQVDEKLHDVRRVINRYRPVQLLLQKSSSTYVKSVKQIARQICNPYIVEVSFQTQAQKISQTLNRFVKDSKAALFKRLLSLCISSKKHDEKFEMFATVKGLDLVRTYLQNMKLKEKVFDEGIFTILSFQSAKLKPFFDSQVYQNLQVFRIKNEDQSDGKKGTLVAFLDHCLTNSGKKLLRRWLNEPLVVIEAITERQQCIKQIVQSQQHSVILTFHQKLIAYQKLQKNIADVYHWVVKGYEKNWHRLTEELSFEKGYDQKKNPAIVRIKEILRILGLLGEFQKLLTELKEFKLKSRYFTKFAQISVISAKRAKKIETGQEQLQSLPDLHKLISSILSKIEYNETTDFLQPTHGSYPQYDNQKHQKNLIQAQLQAQLQKWRKHFNNNKISYAHVKARNQIQVPKICLKSRKDKPKQLIFSSQTANFERFTTAKTNELSEQLMVHERRIAKSYEPFLHDVVDMFCQHKVVWDKYVNAVSEIDVIFSLAKVCKRMAPRCLPKFCIDDENSVLNVKGALHPGLLQVIEPQNIVSNSLRMKNEERILLLTGPNMGGKSTLLRQTCLLAILAQIGSYVPCQQYQTIVFDQIFCRIGASDRLIQGKSTFYVELQETNRILKQATSSSLVIIDELGRGTSTYDGMAIAEATIKYILENIGSYTLFSTHYTPITRDFLGDECVKCAKMSYRLLEQFHEKKDKEKEPKLEKLEFLYQVEAGVAQKSFANNVARMVGLPQEILVQADKKAEWISEMHQDAQKKWKKIRNINHLVQLGIIQPREKQVQI